MCEFKYKSMQASKNSNIQEFEILNMYEIKYTRFKYTKAKKIKAKYA